MNIINNGYLSAFTTPFNGYFIAGTYGLQGVGFLFNYLFFSGNIVTLPQSIAVVSYAFMGMCVAFPVLLLHRLLHPLAITWLVAMSTFVPLPIMEYGILGSTANSKFIFLYVAALLVIYRHHLNNTPWKYFVVDGLLLFICLTNIIACALLPFLLVKYLPLLRSGYSGIKKIIQQPSFISMVLLLLLVALLGAYTTINGISEIGGIYNKPYQWINTVEIFVARSYLFGFLYSIYPYLSDVKVTIIMIVLLGVSIFFVWRKYLFEMVFLTLSIGVITFLIIKGRPVISTLFDSYTNGAYDQYFFAQNIIAYVIGAFVITAILAKIKSAPLKLCFVILPFILLPTIITASSFGANNYMAERRGTIQENLAKACQTQNTGMLTIHTYPVQPFTFKTNATSACKGIATVIERKKIEPSSDGVRVFMPGHTDKFTQTFRTHQDTLKGIAIELVTFQKGLSDKYVFKLMNADCSAVLFTTSINQMQVIDNGYYPIKLPTYATTKNREFCFTIEPIGIVTQSFAINLTDPDSYMDGEATINGGRSHRDIVFSLAY